MLDTLMLFMYPLAACLMLGIMLGYLGLHVLKREVIFIDMAVAQFAAVGAIAAHMVLHVHGDSPTALVAAWGATVVAGGFYAVVRYYVTGFPLEAVIGISYAAAAAGALMLIGKGSSGHSHVQEMLTGSLLWVGSHELVWSGVIFVIGGILLALWRRPIQRVSDNYHAAVKSGMQVIWWDVLFYAICGLIITASVRLAGVVVVFCFLIIPATAASLLVRGWLARLMVAVAFSLVASFGGLLFCQHFDFSAGVSVALMMGVLLLIVSAVSTFSKNSS